MTRKEKKELIIEYDLSFAGYVKPIQLPERVRLVVRHGGAESCFEARPGTSVKDVVIEVSPNYCKVISTSGVPVRIQNDGQEAVF